MKKYFFFPYVTEISNLLGLFLIGLLIAEPVFAADVDRGKELFGNCVQCHGIKGLGNDKLKAPALAGQPIWYLKSQLENYTAGIRGYHQDDIDGLLMGGVFKAFSATDDVSDLLSYIVTLNPKIVGDRPMGNIRQGSGSFAVCGSCHGSKGQGNKGLASPRLDILSNDYIKRQLSNFRNGLRGSHEKDELGQQMVDMAAMFPEEEQINNILAYLGTLNSKSVID